MRTALVLILTLALSASHSQARFVHIPSYDELFSKADVILIVRPGETRDAQGDDVTQPLGVSGLDDYVTAVVTPLKILRVVKGDFKQKEMDLPRLEGNTAAFMMPRTSIVFPASWSAPRKILRRTDRPWTKSMTAWD